MKRRPLAVAAPPALLSALVAACCGSAELASPTTPTAPSPDDLLARATRLAHDLVIVDGHIDLPFRLEEGKVDGKPSEDPTERTAKGEFDWVRAKAGGLDAPFMSIYVPAEYQEKGGAKALADTLIDMVEDLARRAPDKFALVRGPDDVVRASAAGLVSLPMGIENGAAIEGKLDNLAHFHARGVRYITLTHGKDNDISDSSYDDRHTHHGLSAFGVEVVHAMNRLGIMVDVAHISDEAFDDVMAATDVPVIASHSSCRHFTPGFERNMSDDMIVRLAKEGGVIMINFGSTFIDPVSRAQGKAYWDAVEAFAKEKGLAEDAPEVEAFATAYKKEHPLQLAPVERVADHIDHVVRLVGIDHVGLGSDFDGVGPTMPVGLEDVSKLPNLIKVLLERGYDEAAIAKICAGNVFRVWRAVEAAAAPR